LRAGELDNWVLVCLQIVFELGLHSTYGWEVGVLLVSGLSGEEDHEKPEDVVAVAIWQVDDVLGQAKEKRIKITRKQAEEIIERIDRRQDASLGISWDTIDAYLDDLD
jgi:hypothetical protein